MSKQDFEIDLVVRHIHPTRVIDRISIDRSPEEGVLDPCILGESKIPPFTHDLAAQVGGINSHKVIGRVTRIGIRL